MGLGVELLLGENFGEIGTGNISRVRPLQDPVRNIKGYGFIQRTMGIHFILLNSGATE